MAYTHRYVHLDNDAEKAFYGEFQFWHPRLLFPPEQSVP